MNHRNAGTWHFKAFRNNYLAALIAGVLIGFTSFAQVDTTHELSKRNASYADKQIQADSSARFPQDTFKLKSTWRGFAFKGVLPYYWDGQLWSPFGSAVTASNGLTKVGSVVQFGGLMTKNDTLNLNNHLLHIYKATDADLLFDYTNNNGSITLLNHGLLEVGFAYNGFDYGFVRNQVTNAYDGSVGPGFAGAAAGWQAVMSYNNNTGQFYVGGPGNGFCDNCTLIDNISGTGVKIAAHGSNSIRFTGNAFEGSGEYARFQAGTGRFGINISTPGQRLSVAGSFRATDSMYFHSLLGSGTDSLYTKRSDGTLGAIAPSALAGVNIYNSDGSLTANRTLSLNGHTLTIDRGTALSSIITSQITDLIQYTNPTNFTEIFGGSSGTTPSTNYVVLHAQSGTDARTIYLYPDQLQIVGFGAGLNTGTPTFSLQVDNSGKVIEGPVSTTFEQSLAAQGSTTFGANYHVKLNTHKISLDSGSLLIHSRQDTAFYLQGTGGNPLFRVDGNNNVTFMEELRMNNFATYGMHITNNRVYIGSALSAIEFQNGGFQKGYQQPIEMLFSYPFIRSDPSNAEEFTIDNDSLSTGPFPFVDSVHLFPLVVKFTNHNNGQSDNKFKVRGDGAIQSNFLKTGGGNKMLVSDANGYINADAVVTSGDFTPTLSGVTNVAASSINSNAGHYQRVGNEVSFSISLSVSPTAGSAFTEIDYGLPVASNLATSDDLGGTVSVASGAFVSGDSIGDATNDRGKISFMSISTSPHLVIVTGHYVIK